jgi:DNA-directed RNA polymerase sigma subunit (sigma70/sigma32)
MRRALIPSLVEKTAAEIGKELGMTTKAVQCTEERAMKKLRKNPKLRELLKRLIESGTYETHGYEPRRGA